MYNFGGQIGSSGLRSNSNFLILNLKNNKWREQIFEGTNSCGARDDHASVFDEENKIFYVFSGYVNGGFKSNDIWKYELAS